MIINEVIERTKNRTYIEPNQNLMPGITHMGWLDFSSATQALKPHTHNGAIEFCYLERGVAVFSCGKQKWQLNGGDCFVSYPDEIHGTGSHPLERMKLYWIGYRPEIMTPWLTGNTATKTEQKQFESAVGIALPRTFIGSKRLGTAIGSTIDAYLGKSRFKSIEIQTALLNLFLHLADKKSKPHIISPEIQNVISYIKNNTHKDISLTEGAEIAGISLSRFKTRFKTETGIPPAEFILRERIDKSASMILKGISILDTSIECGFSSSQYFATVFRRYKNASPSEWRHSQLFS